MLFPHFRRRLAVLSLGAFTLLAEEEFRPLFNGRDLTGWVNVNCADSTWSATNGVIFCTGAPIGELRTERMYQNFVLEAEWRHLRPKGNAGIFVWADALTAKGQPFIRGVEVQVLDGQEGAWFTSDGDIFPIHGAKLTPHNGRGGDRAFPTEKRVKPSPEWNHYRIECVNGAISLAVNGKVVTTGTNASPRKGYICLESEGSPVEFRNVRIRELPPMNALPPALIANSDEHFRPLYNGLNLDGWVARQEPSAWKPNDWTLTGSPTNGGGIRTEEMVGDGEFILDWRWTDAKAPGDWTKLVRLRGQDLAPLLATADRARLEAKPGEWNRVRIRIRGSLFDAQLNSQPLVTGKPLPGPAAGPLELNAPNAPAELANLFWRRLD